MIGDPQTAEHDGTAALAILMALMTNLDARGFEVIDPVRRTIAEVYACPGDERHRQALKSAIENLAAAKAAVAIGRLLNG